MKTKSKHVITCITLFILLGCAAFYVAMEDYQKENMARFLKQTFASAQQ